MRGISTGGKCRMNDAQQPRLNAPTAAATREIGTRMESVHEVKREVSAMALRTTVLLTAGHRINGLLDRIGIAIDPLLRVTDQAAAAVIGLAFAIGTMVFCLVPADPARLTRFTAEHVAIFNMKDSAPQRIAFSAFIAILADWRSCVTALLAGAAVGYCNSCALERAPYDGTHTSLGMRHQFRSVRS